MADVNVTITVPDAWVIRTLEAINGMADKDIRIEFERAIQSYKYEAKTALENNLQFAKRVFKEMILQHIKAFELDAAYDVYFSSINAIEQPTEDVPEDLLT